MKPHRSSSSIVAATSSKRFRHHHDWLYTDPDGYHRDFGYDIMKRSYEGRVQDVTAWVRRQVRLNTAELTPLPLTHAVPREDFVQNLFLVPDHCPMDLGDAHGFWTALQANELHPEQDMWAGPTIWFPDATNYHEPFRRVREFIETYVVERLHTPAHLIAHDPTRVGGKGDFHVHVIISARKVGKRGLSSFEPSIFHAGCQRNMWRAWMEFMGQ